MHPDDVYYYFLDGSEEYDAEIAMEEIRAEWRAGSAFAKCRTDIFGVMQKLNDSCYIQWSFALKVLENHFHLIKAP
jgi:hypothetical protein